MGNYNEPAINLKVSMEELMTHQSIEYMMVFDTKTGKWEIVVMQNKGKEMIGLAEFSMSTKK